ncbi:hypothetical protein ANANG_G00257480 [Anguilla anguilla]|uniref:Uncharacterized protein n=1 Tax=Anguilla anguilla TaxID=7936 RepID=A0A9D3LPF8_ANGAN|nr:hypothetical protein ANANG_G00257480 [Anguilla anguilla]
MATREECWLAGAGLRRPLSLQRLQPLEHTQSGQTAPRLEKTTVVTDLRLLLNPARPTSRNLPWRELFGLHHSNEGGMLASWSGTKATVVPTTSPAPRAHAVGSNSTQTGENHCGHRPQTASKPSKTHEENLRVVICHPGPGVVLHCLLIYHSNDEAITTF